MLDFSKREKLLISFLLILILTTSILTYIVFFHKKPEIAFKIDEAPAIPVTSPVETEKIIIHVVGAVKNPGVYSLDEGKRVKDAIDIAGGPLTDADLFRLNLAQKLQDEDKLYVPKVGETPSEDSLDGDEMIGLSFPDDGKININKADSANLIQLPGVGPATAQKILDYRSKNGPFKNIEDIKNVSGIGEKKFEQIKDKIKVK